MSSYDHIVVGAGVNGLWTAYHLARRGCRVLIIEQFFLPHSRGSSHGPSRGIRSAYPDPDFTKLMEVAYLEWRGLEQSSGISLIKETGLLCFSDDKENRFVEKIRESFSQIPGSIYTNLDSQAMRTQFPQIKCGENGRGCYDPSGGIILADKALKCIQRCVELGVDIKDGDGAAGIVPQDGRVNVTTKSGKRYCAKSCVICAGPWAKPLLKQLGYTLPLDTMKIPVYYWKSNNFISHNWTYEGEGRMVWGLASHEYPGLVKICPNEGPLVDPDKRDSASTEDAKQFTKDFIGRMFDGVEPEVEIEESCIYTLTPDLNPVIDTLPSAPAVVVAAGFSGTGFKLGPVTGIMLADLAQGVKARQEIASLSIERFLK